VANLKAASASTLGLTVAFVLLWNSGFIAAEFGLPSVDPFALLFWRYGALSVLLFGYLLARDRLVWPGATVAGRAALVGVLAHGVWLGCVLVAIAEGVPSGIVALVVALQPLATGALSGPIAGERTSLLQWLGLALGFAGVAIAVGTRLDTSGSVSTFGYLVPFGSVVAITVASLLQRRWEVSGTAMRLPVDAMMFYQSAATTVAMAIPAAIAGLQIRWTLTFVVAFAWLVVAVSLAAYALMWMLLSRLDATRVASLFYLGPPVTMAMAWVAFGDRPQTSDLVGMAVVAAGILAVQRSTPKLPR